MSTGEYPYGAAEDSAAPYNQPIPYDATVELQLEDGFGLITVTIAFELEVNIRDPWEEIKQTAIDYVRSNYMEFNCYKVTDFHLNKKKI